MAIKWATSTAVTNMFPNTTSGLLSWANNAYKVSNASGGAYYDNATNKFALATAELKLTFGTTPTVSAVSMWISYSFDNTNYSYITTPPANNFVGSFIIQASTTAQYLWTPPFQILPFRFHVILHQLSGQTTSATASSSTFKLFPLAQENS